MDGTELFAALLDALDVGVYIYRLEQEGEDRSLRMIAANARWFKETHRALITARSSPRSGS